MAGVLRAIRAEITALGVKATTPGLVAVAVELARQMDGTEEGPLAPTAAAVVGRELRAVMADLRKLAPVREEGDSVDDIARQRERRRADARRQQSG